MARRKKTDTSKPGLSSGTKVKFVTGEEKDTGKESLANITETIRQNMQSSHIKKVQEQQLEILAKSVKPLTLRKDQAKKSDKNKIVYSTREWSNGFDGVDLKDWRRLSDTELRELSQVDPYIAAIISTRCSQSAVCGRPSDSKFDKGTRMMELKPLKKEDFKTEEDFEQKQRIRKQQISKMLDWMFTCGSDDESLLNDTFAGTDSFFKKCSLPEYISAQVRNLLTFGRAHAQKFRDADGSIQLFRPATSENIYKVTDGEEISLSNGDDTAEQSAEDAKEYNDIEDKDARPVAYVQRIDGRNVNFFTEYDMDVLYLQKQALFDLSGYPLSPIEQAIYMVFTHQQTLGYLRNQFVKGLGNKGILALQSTDAAAQLSDEDLETLRREFHNFVSRNDNAAATPVISGPVAVNYIPLSSNPKDMEFLQVEEHVIRALCSAMQISPQEMGYGHLSINQGGLTSTNKQEEIIRGEERGLRMLLDVIFDHLNDIMYDNFPEARELYRLTYVGVGEDTRDSVVGRHQQELNTTATLSSLWADSEKTDPVPYGGSVPLSSVFHANVVRYMKYGQFMEKFMGEKGWADKPEYDFIIDAALNQAYQQLKVQPVKMQQEGAMISLQSQEMQLKQMAQQEQMADQQGQMQAQQDQQAPQQEQESAPAEDQSGPPEAAHKSLREEFESRNKLEKSMSYYFHDWMSAHND